MEERIQRARWLLKNSKHAAMATVNEDNTPHNTPYFFMASDDLQELYWGSHPDSVHSKNILRTGDLFVVLYEANERGGLFIRCTTGRIAEGEELERALKKHNELRARHGTKPLPLKYYTLEYYTTESPQKMWVADAEKFWVNFAERDEQGRIVQDLRHEIDRSTLLA
ncbi:MAG TPA: pyridoxamine 5'-phosphate oxidase family protein [Candidatus Saccharimonadales bacterium]|nr:pyridoxamine 5'-phosphate oxidase family protein [Candidatus Saccharimonadales bacterium]